VMTFTPPANVLIEITTTESGVAPGAASRLTQNSFIIDAITPETATSCHYFWASARSYDIDDQAYSDFTRDVVIRAFNEDKDMLEAQQRNLGRGKGPEMVDVNGDNGALQARRLVDRLLAEETATRAAAE